MLNLEEATKRIETEIPRGKIDSVIPYKNLFVFLVYIPLPEETGFDPFYSVDRDTGEVRDFSIITDGNPDEITALFIAAKEGG